MKLTSKKLGSIILTELETGYEVVKVSRIALDLYQDSEIELTPEINNLLLELIAMEEGPEFEFSEKDLFELANKLFSN